MKNNKLYLYLDDVRTPKADNWEVVRNYDEFTTYITRHGIPDLISFDHDLGEEDHEKLVEDRSYFLNKLSKGDMIEAMVKYNAINPLVSQFDL